MLFPFDNFENEISEWFSQLTIKIFIEIIDT